MTVTPPAAPTIACPAGQTVQATSQAGATVTYSAPTVNGGVAPITATSQPPSGSVFPIGTTTVTATATDALNRSASCTLPVNVTATQASTFAVGDRVAAASTGVLVRSTPGMIGDSTPGNGNTLALNPPGALGVVFGGPTVADGYTWWLINYDTGFDGWSTELNLVKSTAPPPPLRFGVGDRVIALSTGVLARSTPGFGTNGSGDNVLGLHVPGELGTVTGGPKIADGYTWWVIDYDTGPDGWSTEPNLDRASNSTGPSSSLTYEWAAGPITVVPDTVPVNYMLYYGLQSGSYLYSVDVGINTTYVLNGLKSQTTYFAAVSACNELGQCGPLSAEVTGVAK